MISAWLTASSYASVASHSPRARLVWRIRTPDSSPNCPPYPVIPSPASRSSSPPGHTPCPLVPAHLTLAHLSCKAEGHFLDLLGMFWQCSLTQIRMNDLFFLSQHIVNPGGRLNMSLMMFIPADEVQLGRWALLSLEEENF